MTNHELKDRLAHLKPGDHLCCVYETEEEHRALLTPFLRQGLERNERVIYIVDARTAEAVLDYLRQDGVDVEPYLERGQLQILAVADSYMKEGAFDPDRMIALLGQEAGRAIEEGYAALRVTGEMSWALRGLPGSEKLIEYEAKLNTFFPGSECLAMCQYDRRRFEPAVLLDVLSTHPIAVVGTAIYDNFYYAPPEDLLGPAREAAQLSHWIHNLADRGRMERALQSSKSFLDSVVEQSPYPMWISDDKGTLIRINQACCDLLNIVSDEVVGKYNLLQDNIVQEQGLLPLFKSVFEEGKTVRCEITYDSSRLQQLKLRNTASLILDTTVSPIEEADGTVTNAVIQHVDITKQRRAEAALRESKLLLDATGHMARVGGWEVEAKTLEVRWTEQTYCIHELPLDYRPQLEEAINFFHPEDRDRLSQAIQRALHHGEPYDMEIRFITARGNRLWTRTICHPQMVSGKTVKLLGTFQDITERKQAEEALRRSGERYRSLVENIGIGVSMISPDMEILTLNKQMQEWFPDIDASKRPICYQAFNNPPRKGVCSYCPTCKTLKDGQVHESITNTPAGNRVTHFRILSSPITDESGEVIAAIEMVEDITERVEAEEEKKHLEAQLRQAQKMEAIGTLAGGIAHDFNNMLGIILGNTELAMDDLTEWSPAQDNLKEVCNTCLRGKSVVRQILTYSRKTGQQVKPVNLGPVIKDVLKLLRSSMPAAIDIQQHIAAETHTVLADATQIHQVLINLCTNAVQAMGEEEGVLAVGLENFELGEAAADPYPDLEPGNYVRLTVCDTGQGVAPGFTERIFEPYFTTKEVGQGTGMGLAVVHGIVKSHGGAISVDSAPGKETAFRVLLPAVEADLTAEAAPLENIPTGNERILLVDDEEPLADIGKQILERLGYEVVAKCSSREALELFQQAPDGFDLVVTDLTMPRMTGDRLGKELTRTRPDIPVILCTGFGEHVNEEKVKARGIRGLIAKPFRKAQMAQKVRQVLDSQKKMDL